MKFEIKHRFTGAVLFSAETENLRLCIELAVKSRVSLRGAYLRGADLRGANLRGADLRGANLMGANLWGADLMGADLMGANLMGAYLRGANLMGAYLRGADLMGAYLRGADLRGAIIAEGVTVTKAPLQLLGLNWDVTIWDAHMQIGCKFHSHVDWATFSDAEIAEMDDDAPEFWATHKITLMALCKSHGG